MSEALIASVWGLLTSRYTYMLFAFLLVVGLYIVVASPNLVKKVIGLNLFQTAIFLFFVSTAYVSGGSSPVIPAHERTGLYASPLPQVLVLTAIVVGIALTAVALALIVRIYDEYGTLDEETLREVRADD
jgi:multicomponent Na+:H+ antiporter subunit C